LHPFFLFLYDYSTFSHDITEIRPSLAAVAAFQPALAQPPLLLPPPPPPPLLPPLHFSRQSALTVAIPTTDV
jgi:hypothetical protein